MAIPTAVQRQAEESDRAIAEAEAAAAAGAQGEPSGSQAGTASLEDAAGQERPSRPQADAGSVPREQYEKVLAQYHTMRGKYVAEVPRLSMEMKALQAQVEQMGRAPAEPDVPAHLRLLKPEEREAYKDQDDALGVPGRAALGMMEDRVAQKFRDYDARLARATQAGEQSQRSLKVEHFLTAVERLVPGARQMDSSPELHQWLESEVDPDSGLSMGKLMGSAVASGDVRRAADIMQAAQRDLGIGAQQDINRQVKPDRIGGEPSRGGSRHKPTINESEVRRFYDDLVKGKYAGREDRAKQIEAAIDSAFEEGRIAVGS